MKQFRHLLASRKARLLIASALIAAIAVYARDIGLMPKGLPEAGVLVVDLRNSLPDKAEQTPDGRRSVSAVEILRALDAARADRRIAGLYLRVGGGGMPLAHALETADAVLRLRRAGKFAVVYAEAFTAANLSDRVLAASADEVWTATDIAGANGRLDDVPTAVHAFPSLPDAARKALWSNLLIQATEHISAAAAAGLDDAASSVNAVARSGRLPAPQFRRGPEAQAEQSALAWGGADAAFVDFLTWRDVLDRHTADVPVLALVQAEGILSTRDGPGPRDLAASLAEQMQAAARDRRVKGIILRISAVAATEDALAQLLEAAGAIRRGGTPVAISFGPVVPVSAAALRGGEIPLLATGGALLVDVSGTQAAALAETMRFPWRSASAPGVPAAFTAAEAPFLERGTAIAAIAASPALAAAGLPRQGANAVPAESSFAEVAWRGDTGTLLDVKDRLLARAGMRQGHALPLWVYEPRPSVLERTNARLLDLWRQMRDWAREIPQLVTPAEEHHGG